MMGIHRGKDGGDAAVDDLNAKSLSAAKSGTSFAPPTKPTAEPAKSTKAMKPMHHHMKKAKKAAADDAAAAPAGTPTHTGSK